MDIGLSGTDLDWVDGDLVLIDGVTARGQELLIRWSWIQGEWFEDVDRGIPLFDDVAVKGATEAKVGAVYQVEAAKVVGFLRFERFACSIDRTSRQVTIEGRAIFEEGPFDFSKIVEVP